MKAIFLVRTGVPEKAFQFRETKLPQIKDNEVLIQTEASGLNFADVVAREGMYNDAPPLPSVLGYDVVGRITECGNDVRNLKPGDRVAALTRFGGYAEYAATNALAVVKIPDSLGTAAASALATQFCTAWYCAAVAANLQEGEKVVIHSAAGGVGNALLQYAKHKKCEVFATTSSSSKVDFLKKQGAAHVLNTSTENFVEFVREKTKDDGVDVIFDALGGSYVRKGIKLLAPGGRIICYGATQMSGASLPARIKMVLQFGFYHPAQFMMSSRSMIGVNMLHIADKRPDIIQHCLQAVIQFFNDGIFVPLEGKLFPVSEVAAAHRYLQEKKATGKVALSWK